MNHSYPLIDIHTLPPAISQLGHDLPRALVYLLIPIELLYFSIYFHLKGYHRLYKWLSFASIATFWLAKVITPIRCNPAECLQNFAGTFSYPKAKYEEFQLTKLQSPYAP